MNGAGGRSVFITGADGYIGRKLVRGLADEPGGVERIVATDVREVPGSRRQPGVTYAHCDVREAQALRDLMETHEVDTVVHLASIVTPGKDSDREFEYSVDVTGSTNVAEACVATGVAKLIVTSSGAAYGYHADSPEWLDEEDALRGNQAFAYSHHKREVEEMLRAFRRDSPRLKQLIFRPGTVLGEGVENQITALFQKPFVLGVVGSASPFVFIWDEDVVACLIKGIREPGGGIYNMAGDGVLTMREIAERVGKPYVPLPAGLVTGALGVLHPLGLSRYGPEQLDFLRYRPVLSNRRLKEEFGFTPRMTTAEVFDFYWNSRGGEGAAS